MFWRMAAVAFLVALAPWPLSRDGARAQMGISRGTGMAPAGAALAQGNQEPRQGAQVDREKLRDQIFDQLRAERMWKITDTLKLDEAHAAKVFPLLSKYDDRERAIGHERGEVHRELRQALDAPTPDSARIDAMIERLVSLRQRRQALELEKLAALRKVLSPVQMGKLMLLVPRLDEGLRARIREALDAAGERDKAPLAGPRGAQGSHQNDGLPTPR